MIGVLKHALRLQEQHRVPDGGGGWHTVWQDVTLHPRIYASIASLGGGDAVQFYKRTPQVSHRLRIRYRGDIAAGMRMVDDSRAQVYEVLSVRDVAGDERWLEIAARRAAL